MSIDTNKTISGVYYNDVPIPLKGSEPVYPDEYVSDGLLLRYDAIDNTRNGHDISVTTWEDLSGNGYDLMLKAGDMPIIGDNFYYFYNAFMQSDTSPNVGNVRFVEAVIQFATSSGEKYIIGTGNPYTGTIEQNGQKVGIRKDSLEWSIFGDFVDKSKSIFAAYHNIVGENVGWVAEAEPFSTSWSQARNVMAGAYSESLAYSNRVYICAYRLYDRILTVEERTQNFKQDIKRFGLSDGSAFTLEELFNALPDLQGTTKTIYVSPIQKAEASAETIAIATNKGWTVA